MAAGSTDAREEATALNALFFNFFGRDAIGAETAARAGSVQGMGADAYSRALQAIQRVRGSSSSVATDENMPDFIIRRANESEAVPGPWGEVYNDGRI